MNWYKQILAGTTRTFKPIEFLKALRPYGVIVERQGSGSRSILLNTTNNMRTDFHQHKGKDIDRGAVRGILNDLGINYWAFMKGSEPFSPKAEPQVQEEQLPTWQKQPWYQQQQQYMEPATAHRETNMNWFKKISKNIPGGLADKNKPEDFDPKQIEHGIKVEMEHTKNKELAKDIAMDHLKEFPNYYTELDKMEKKLEG